VALILHSHPLASYCHKVLIALYEAGTPFEAKLVDLMDPAAREAFLAISPWGKMPVLEDPAAGRTVFETSIIVEYLDRHHPGRARLLPADPDAALEVRLWDRVFDLYVQTPMQAAVSATMRGEPAAVEAATQALRTAYAHVDAHMVEAHRRGRKWAAGEAFSLADCAAAPGLFYAAAVTPFATAYPALGAYFERLAARPSVARTLAEAAPYMHMFPLNERLEPRFRPPGAQA
jgi:glutathione S-transferase